jgi:ribosomal protein L29
MTLAEIREQDDRGIVVFREQLRGELAALRLQGSGSAARNPAGLTRVRRTLARVETVIRQRELAAGEAGGALAARVGALGSDNRLFSSFQSLLGLQKKEG